MKNLDDVMADTAAQQSHPFLVEISQENGETYTMRAKADARAAVLVELAEKMARLFPSVRIVRNGRVLWRVRAGE